MFAFEGFNGMPLINLKLWGLSRQAEVSLQIEIDTTLKQELVACHYESGERYSH